MLSTVIGHLFLCRRASLIFLVSYFYLFKIRIIVIMAAITTLARPKAKGATAHFILFLVCSLFSTLTLFAFGRYTVLGVMGHRIFFPTDIPTTPRERIY